MSKTKTFSLDYAVFEIPETMNGVLFLENIISYALKHGAKDVLEYQYDGIEEGEMEEFDQIVTVEKLAHEGS